MSPRKSNGATPGAPEVPAAAFTVKGDPVERAAVFRKLAETWLAAADEVAIPALKRCYVERATTYEAMAAREAGRRGSAPMPGRRARRRDDG